MSGAGGEGGLPQAGVVLLQAGQVPAPPARPCRTRSGPLPGPPTLSRVEKTRAALPASRCPRPALDAGLCFSLRDFLQPCFFRKTPEFQSRYDTVGCSLAFHAQEKSLFFGGADISASLQVFLLRGLTEHIHITALFTATRVLGENYYFSPLLPWKNRGGFYFQCFKFPGEHSSPLF